MGDSDNRDLLSTIMRAAAANSLRVALTGAAVAILLSVNIGAALAGDDDDDDDLSFEQKIIRNLMHGIGAVDGTEKGIDYKERSPLVVPPKIDLPPPEQARTNTAPNWPKDPDVEERRKARLAAKNRDKSKEWGVVLTPAEMKAGTARAKTATSSPQPGDPFSAGEGKGAILSPSQLGFKGFSWNSVFGGDKPEETKFDNEPARESLTQPPAGYQTPSPNYAYGIGAQDTTKQRPTNWQEQNPAQQKF